jgi:tRNA(fMet)-specific endonuclease VapC
MALLDTTALIDLGRRSKSSEHRNARAAVQRMLEAGGTLFTSRINEAEFRVGPEMAQQRQQEIERVERVLAGIAILEFNRTAAMRYAVIKAIMLKRGRPAGDCDTLIASIALANGQSVLTRNPRHFNGIPGLVVQSY